MTTFKVGYVAGSLAKGSNSGDGGKCLDLSRPPL
jgi:hypothetical protein